MDRKNGQRNGGNEITATLPRSAVTAIGANGRRRSNYKLPSIGRSVLRDRRFAFPVSRFPFPVFRLGTICLSLDSMDDFRRTRNALVDEPRT